MMFFFSLSQNLSKITETKSHTFMLILSLTSDNNPIRVSVIETSSSPTYETGQHPWFIVDDILSTISPQPRNVREGDLLKSAQALKASLAAIKNSLFASLYLADCSLRYWSQPSVPDEDSKLPYYNYNFMVTNIQK